MSYNLAPHFPRGFLLSTKPTTAPTSFIKGPILPNFYVHPLTNVEVAGDSDSFVISLGHLVPTLVDKDERPIYTLLLALRDSEASFLRALSNFGGRHALIFGSEGNIRVVNDAASQRSVFYAKEGAAVASHPLLVERTLGGLIRKNELPFRYGYPGNQTPYSRVRILTPNTYYWLTANVVRRFWPIASPPPQTSSAAATKLLEYSTTALKRMSRGRTVKLTLTAGLDSRTIFALALNAGIKFTTYTYGDDKATQVDRDVARDLSIRFGVPHTILPRRVSDPDLKTKVLEAHYQPLHHGPWVRALKDHFDDTESLAVLGNLLEIGRSNSSNERRQGISPPIDAQSMANLHYLRMGRARQDEIETFGLENFCKISKSAFQSFIDETGFSTQAGLLDPFDQFYWEHRMATWQGYAMGERDFYALPFIPYNSRNIFEIMLGVPKRERHTDQTVYKMIDLIDPALLDIPINPKRWP